MLRRNTIRRLFSSVPSDVNYKGNKCLGMVREEYGMWERRAPLAPVHVKKLVDQGFKVLVQPCTRRIFSDSEYKQVGAVLSENLNEANMIIGVKQIPKENIFPGKSHMFFSHVIKAQPGNMPLLDTILEKKARLFDYECITEGGRHDASRLVAFGKYAGMAGMVDGLQGLGQRLLADGFTTPFINIPMTYMSEGLDRLKELFQRINQQIRSSETLQNEKLDPIVFAFSGTGNVSKGAREIFELLPHKYITVSELPNLKNKIQEERLANKNSETVLYGVIVTAEDYVKLKSQENINTKSFDKKHFYTHPELYESHFHNSIAPYITGLVNGVYWDERFPRLLTKKQIISLRKSGNNKLKTVIDITCDVGGSVEFLGESTKIEKPFFSYLPETDTYVDCVDKNGIMMLGVDILPSEIPRDASHHFGNCLIDLIPPMLTSKGELSDLPPEIQRACIASDGQLLPHWTYISRMRQQKELAEAELLAEKNSKNGLRASGGLAARDPVFDGKTVAEIELRGHLFDSGLINQVLDTLEMLAHELPSASEVEHGATSGLEFNISRVDVRPNIISGQVPSRLHLTITGGCEVSVKSASDAVKVLVEKHPRAQCTFNMLDYRTPSAVKGGMKKVLLFGAGRVAKPVMRLFDNYDNVSITIATAEESQGQDLIRCLGEKGQSHAKVVTYKFPQDNSELLPQLFKDCDVAISLLPATMHIPLAKEAIKQKKHLVTASYTSPEMKLLDKEAKEAGIIIMNEVGLDPGIDHMLIMKAVDTIHKNDGVVEELVSLCGGLPDPVAADNPFMYKLSWSPRGVLLATQNPAHYLNKNVEIKIPAGKLLANASPSSRFPTMRLEVLPNRDSLSYRELYNVPNVHSICRGTLRYEGWADIMQSLNLLGLLSVTPFSPEIKTWGDYLEKKFLDSGLDLNLLKKNNVENRPLEMLRLLLEKEKCPNIADGISAFLYLEIVSTDASVSGKNQVLGLNPLDSVCSLMEKHLQFKEGEKDMVAMFHTIVGKRKDGKTETHTTRLLDFGSTDSENGDTSMARTVGYTVAAAAELILNNNIPKNIRGCVIPTDENIYNPILERLKKLGISWTDTVTISK